MKITLTSVCVDDQAKALDFYVGILGFIKKVDMELPGGAGRWLTVVSPEAPEGVQLLLEPEGHPAVKTYKSALVKDGIPITSFEVDDVQKEYERLIGRGVSFTTKPVSAGPTTIAVFDDTCGNLIQIHQVPGA